MLRVCHIITHLEMGGAQGNTLHTVTNLDRREFAPILIAGVGGAWEERAHSIPGVVWAPLPSMEKEFTPRRDAVAFRDLVRILKQHKPHIVHTHCSKAGVLGRWAARMAGVPIIIHTAHGFGFTPTQGKAAYNLFLNVERLTSACTTAYIVVSRSNWDDGKRLNVFGNRPVHLIRSGIDLSRFRFVAAEAKRFEAAPRIGCIGRLNPQKAPLDFVRVAAIVRERIPNAKFVMVGDGPLKADVEAEIDRLNLEENFSLLGVRADVPEIMASLDILVHTARYEGLARIFPEAMASNLPIVATAVDGARDIIVDGANGYLCAPGDVEGLSRRVVELASDPAKARSMASGDKSILDEFDIDQMVRRQEELYRTYAQKAGLITP